MPTHKQRNWYVGSGLSICVALLFLLFQNCTAGAPESARDLSSTADKVGFAYEAKFDQMAYMSCANLSGVDDSGTFFSFRAGAYQTGGVRIRDDYFHTVSTAGVPVIDRPSLLFLSELNSQVSMQTAIRSKANLQSIYTSNGGSGQEGQDFDNFMTNLGTETNSEFLFRQNDFVRFVSTGDPLGAHMEASLYFGQSGGVVSFLRQFLTADGLISLTFAKAATASNSFYAISPFTVVNTDSGGLTTSGNGVEERGSVFGLGYQVRFSQPSYGTVTAGVPFAVLSSVSEMNLENKRFLADASWTCPSNLQFMIVRPEDVNVSVQCQMLPDPAVYDSEMTVARNALRVEDWFIDRGNHCIVPKKATAAKCYGGAQSVDYAMAAGAAACVEGSTTKPCAAFLSICYKTR